jgi:hypothetical protein
MSKFSKPKPAGAVTQADIDRVIGGADAVDDRKAESKVEPKADEEVRFTMTLSGDLAGRIDRARKAAGGLTRLSWIRLAVAEKLSRDGV